MDCERVIERLELALIELEYASADFSHLKESGGAPVTLADLGAVQKKLAAANEVMEFALTALAADKRLHAA